ncbi:MAG: hypothetical protein MK194_10460 [Roseibacillus sp.]|nr:hypothetical protein [Roseibacillus sp.]
MKGVGTLTSLIVAATAAGVLLVLLSPDPKAVETKDQETGLSTEAYVEDTLGLQFKTAPEIHRVSQEIFLAKIDENLAAQFGAGGLARRSRALELIGFHEFGGHSMRDGLIALQSIGVRGWLDEREGQLLIPNDFNIEEIEDRVILHGLLARLLVHQHSPLVIGRLSDDEWIAQSGLHSAIAESMKAKLRDESREAFELPTSLVTEREALLASLPIYLSALGELPQERGIARIFLETRLRTGSRTLPSLIEAPPQSTLQLLGGDPSAVSPVTIPAPLVDQETQLEESLGAFQLQTLIEWLESYEQAQALALLWRGDRYRLFANSSGDHLLWICGWETEAAATRAAEILSRRHDNPNASKRFFSMIARGKTTILINCADDKTLKSIEDL